MILGVELAHEQAHFVLLVAGEFIPGVLGGVLRIKQVQGAVEFATVSDRASGNDGGEADAAARVWAWRGFRLGYWV